MSHIDTLKAYREALASGFTEKQAIMHAESIDNAFDGLDAVRKAELDYALQDIKTEFALLRKDFAILRWIVLGAGALFAAPIIQQIFVSVRAAFH